MELRPTPPPHLLFLPPDDGMGLPPHAFYHSTDSDSSEDDHEQHVPGHGVAIDDDPSVALHTGDFTDPRRGFRVWLIRALALLCACSLSIGSHYGSYFLGPIKSRLSREIGTSNTEFSLLIAAYNLNNTWTPLVGGVLAARLGTALSSIIATSLIFLGQAILLFGDVTGSITGMAFGLFIFGLGISPLAVVQETIIVRFFSKHGLGVSLALGLLAGKGASFASALTSYPLSESYGPHAPFVVATMLAGFSFGINMLYVAGSGWFARGAGIEPEEAEMRQTIKRNNIITQVERMSELEALQKVVAKRRIRFWDITNLGDIFWAYIAINVLCGAIWSPFTHLAANIIEKRYGLTEMEAGQSASLLLAGSIFLYPIAGYLTDRLKHGPIVHILFILSSILTLICYTWLVLPPSWTKTPLPAMLAFGTGHGFSTLLLVIIVPHLVPIRYVSTALGTHKSLEQTGSTISQTLAGLILDKNIVKKERATPTSVVDDAPTPSELKSIQYLLTAFFIINLLQLAGTLALWKIDARRKRKLAREAQYEVIPTSSSAIDDSTGPDNVSPEDTVPKSPEEEVGPLVAQPVSPSRRRSISPEVEAVAGGRPRENHPRSWSTRSDRPLLPPKLPKRQDLLKGLARTGRERRRGKVFATMAGAVIVSAWLLFMWTAWTKMKLRRNGE